MITTANGFSVAQWGAEHAENLDFAYSTERGLSLTGKSEQFLDSSAGKALTGKVQLVFTSPPFPLNRKKKYDNLQGIAFKEWLSGYARKLRNLLTDDGSIVLEMGNAWEPGAPVMSTLALETLLAFKEAGDFFLCQEFIWHNPAKLPTPAQWVTVERIRVKDSFTRLWWMSPVTKPKANNRRVLRPYSDSMQTLLRTGKYNAGKRPSEHVIKETSFLTNNGGAIPPNVLSFPGEEVPESVIVGANTNRDEEYHRYCEENSYEPHPARMPLDLARFFINFCTDEGDVVFDPFAGSNTTGAAAEQLKRQWISVEARSEYASSGAVRFKQSATQPAEGSLQLEAELSGDCAS